ncbi:DEAD/DEAH box helicase [Paraliobacillus sediminis]|uniref:DEAD/DEAH box helicase n=1 Tax=Paraliobacillus sediminis TaxID=1885916 RepID=UPI000E3E59E1|nr:DEAD/DEAH box helicase [Paraliobacillus sediminis]
MNLKLNRKIIEERCGELSYKSGNSFYRANKVKIETSTSNGCKAIVIGKESFYVDIEKKSNEGFQSSCSCPKLASYAFDCQHVAAVLIAIKELQHKTKDSDTSSKLSNGLLEIFNQSTSRTSGQQLHFENRKVIDVAFICKPIKLDEKNYLLTVEVKLNEESVLDIRTFLTHLQEGRPYKISSGFIFDLHEHCFNQETDSVVQLLIQIMGDERLYLEGLSRKSIDKVGKQQMLIPASMWTKLLPLLINVPEITIHYKSAIYQGIKLTVEQLPLTFELTETIEEGYQLTVSGLENMVVFLSYKMIFYDGKFAKLNQQHTKQLVELKRMLDGSNTNEIGIPKQQVNFFLEKVVPGLKGLGKVNITKELQQKVTPVPLIAKLYLDRVKNRLLAGLEFHYENSVINPLENSEPTIHTMFIRDEEKEEQILQIMENSLFATTESGYVLYNEELEYDFLYYKLPELQRLAHVYTTTAIRNRIVTSNNFPKIRVKFKRERTNWLEFKFEMDGIPDDEIRDLLEAIEEKRKYYRLQNGGLLALNTREFEEIHRFLQGLPPQRTGDLVDGLTLPIEKYMEILDSVESSNTFLVEDSFRHFLNTIENPESKTFDVPKNLEPILRDYQVEGFQWLKTLANYGFGGILADDMGLGKTIQSITFILSELTSIREHKQPVLIICPSSVTYNWLNELSKFGSELKVVVIDGNRNKRLKQLKLLTEMDVIITSYPILRQDVQHFEKNVFHTVFFDEAQAFKNPITQTARSVKRIQANHKFALTGTPVENTIEELWAIFHVIFPDLFLGLKEYSTLSRKTIARRARPFLLRRLKTTVLKELPKKTETLESTELLSEQKKLYAAYLAKLRHDTLKHLDKATFRKNKIRILAGLTRLRQICCHPSLFIDDYTGTSAKFEQLLTMIEEIKQSGRRVLIFSQFTKMLDLIGRELTKREHAFFYLDGKTPAEERLNICNHFNDGVRDIFLISMKAGGQGLNLTGADTVIFYDSWWNPAVEEQAADRAYRFGQTRDVQVIKLVAKGTIEEKMHALQDKKRDLIGEIIDPEEQVSSIITEQDIRDILKI